MAEPGHNVADDLRDYEDQKFLQAFAEVEQLNSEKAATARAFREVYDKLPGGFTKDDMKFALELREKDAGQVIATMERRIRIAKLFGHGLARQFEMFDEDRTPIEERAYQEGLAVGKRRGEATNPYGIDSKAGQEWQRGVNDGNTWANRDLASQFEDEDGNALIKAGDDPFPDEADPDEDAEWDAAAPDQDSEPPEDDEVPTPLAAE